MRFPTELQEALTYLGEPQARRISETIDAAHYSVYVGFGVASITEEGIPRSPHKYLCWSFGSSSTLEKSGRATRRVQLPRATRGREITSTKLKQSHKTCPGQHRRVSGQQGEMRVPEPLDHNTSLSLPAGRDGFPTVGRASRKDVSLSCLSNFGGGSWTDCSPTKPLGPFLTDGLGKGWFIVICDKTPRKFFIQSLLGCTNKVWRTIVANIIV